MPISNDPIALTQPLDLASSPILALQGNILWQVENLSSYAQRILKEHVAAGRLSGVIDLWISAEPPRPPSIKGDGIHPPAIRLHVPFLELLWAFIFGWSVRYEEAVQKHGLAGIPLPESGPVAELVGAADGLLTWARGLAHQYTPWPADLPSPRNYGSLQQQYYGEKTNLMFQKAVAYLISHEHAHALLGHLRLAADGATSDASISEMERDADATALNELVAASLDDNEKSAEAWAVLGAILASFYAVRSPQAALSAEKHLALHHRLAHVLDALDFQSEGHQFYFRLLSRLVLQDLFPAELTPQCQFEDADEALTDALDRLDAMRVGPSGGSSR